MVWPHNREPIHHQPSGSSGRLREGIFGLEDGLVSTMGVITGIASGTGARLVILLAGLVVILVESLSMAAGSYLSNKSQQELEARMLREELHEIRHQPEKERAELESFYLDRGFSKPEREILITRIMADEELLLEEMAHKELGIFPDSHEHPGRYAVVMWGTYLLGGIVPLVPYAILSSPTTALPWSIGATAVALFALGAWKGDLVGTSPLKSGFEMFAIAMGAGLVGFLAGSIAGHLFGLPSLFP